MIFADCSWQAETAGSEQSQSGDFTAHHSPTLEIQAVPYLMFTAKATRGGVVCLLSRPCNTCMRALPTRTAYRHKLYRDDWRFRLRDGDYSTYLRVHAPRLPQGCIIR